MAIKEIRVPDLEGGTNVAIVEVYVSQGDEIDVETPLISLESDKAVMDVPSPLAGKITEIKLSEGDEVNTGDLIALVEVADSAEIDPKPEKDDAREAETKKTAMDTAGNTSNQEIRVPDLEGSTDVAVVEVYVSTGDVVEKESPLISLESDKAVMDVPSPLAGTIVDFKIKEGDTINAGDVIAIISVSSSDTPDVKPAPEAVEKPAKEAVKPDNVTEPVNKQPMGAKSHATPSLRALARELGVDLSNITGSGPKGRILRDDVTSMVKQVMSGGTSPSSSAAGGFTLPPIPSIDYAAFGEVETEKLSRIKKISGPHLHRNWIGVPHVTQFEEADITEMEKFRKSLNEENARTGPKLSPLVFIIKASVHALKKFPNFNSSLSPDGSSLIIKKYFNIGIAVDTPEGLTVPVLKNADKKGIYEIAEELTDLSTRAREGKLKSDELKGASFSISSLGGIGGTYFTPIVNAPEVAILGLSRSFMKPVWNGESFEPRLTLPFSVSYDHRAVDGADGARFAVFLASIFGDMRRILL